MGGIYVQLEPGRYTLAVSDGDGPAGVRRYDGSSVSVDIDGGRIDFRVDDEEEVFYWWRGPEERPGVRLVGVSRSQSAVAAAEPETWPTGTMG